MTELVVVERIAGECSLREQQATAIMQLLRDGATVPFIARYRKEVTGNCDETVIRAVQERLNYYTDLNVRKEYIRGVIVAQDALTPALAAKIEACTDTETLEDLYLPFKPKRRTRAQTARERGLEPLADALIAAKRGDNKQLIIALYIDPEKDVPDAAAAIAGATDIIAERVAEDPDTRARLRTQLGTRMRISVTAKKEYRDKRTKFEQYYRYGAVLAQEPSHRILGIRRGCEEKILSMGLEYDDRERFIAGVMQKTIPAGNPFAEELQTCIGDSYDRLLFPSIANEVWQSALDRAEQEAIGMFARNLEHLLLSPPAGRRVILGVDPGFRTGCKLAVVGANSDFIVSDVIYPNEPRNESARSTEVLNSLIARHGVELIAVGNGTASRETFQFIRTALRNSGIPVVVVSESGASVYSASHGAAKEFPGLDLTVRSAINIARRLQDPLAELVKIDPCAIGVGQYQHDVDQKSLKRSLAASVVSCVSRVGVELNTASIELLSHVAGLSESLARKIVSKRSSLKKFTNRAQLREVPGLGEKTYEQCAAFLRISGGDNPLDNSAIHPESYPLVERIAADLGMPVAALVADEAAVAGIPVSDYAAAGEYTLKDVVSELARPGRDPRRKFTYAEFAEAVTEIGDLEQGMVLQGVVTNVTGFGAFVDIGVHQDGLIHISNLSDRFVADPLSVIAAGDAVTVEVLTVDTELKRIGLKRVL